MQMLGVVFCQLRIECCSKISRHQIVELLCLCHGCRLAPLCLSTNHVLALLSPQSFYLPLLMRLHTDVYRYFIVDALFTALKKNKRQQQQQHQHQRGWLVGWVCWEQLLCPCTFKGSKGRTRFITTIILIISMTNWKSLPFSLERGHWSERMSFEIYCTKDATLLYMYLSLCSCSLVVVVLSWLKGFVTTSFGKLCPGVPPRMWTTKIWTPIQRLENL